MREKNKKQDKNGLSAGRILTSCDFLHYHSRNNEEVFLSEGEILKGSIWGKGQYLLTSLHCYVDYAINYVIILLVLRSEISYYLQRSDMERLTA